MNKWLRVGTIVGSFGLKGEVKVKASTDFLDLRFSVGQVLLLNTTQTLLKIRSFRMHKNHVLLAFEDYPDLTSIETLTFGDLMVEANPLPNNQHYAFEYEGCDVYDQLGQYKGKVLKYETSVRHGLLRCLVEDKEVLIPVVDAFILSKDFDHHKIVVNWMEGL